MKAARDDAPSAGQLVEEAVHLLRRAPTAALAIYYGGSVPFVLGLLFFWGHATWFLPPAAELAGGALGLVLAFVVMKTMHAEFCARLLALRLGASAPRWEWRRLGRFARAQMRLQPWALLALAVATLLAVPFGWVFAYAQNVTVLGAEERLHDTAAGQAKLWPGQNHLGLLLISALAVMAWLNLASAFVVVPWLANRLLGIENIFGFSGFWYFNTTFLAAVSALTWLAIDPLVKAFYVLRVFHGRARRSGDDVRVELRLARAAPVIAFIALFALAPRTLRADAAAAPAPTIVRPAELDRAIDRVLDQPEFRWRLQRVAPEVATPVADGPFARMLQSMGNFLKPIPRAIWHALKAVVDWFERRFSDDDAPSRKSSAASGLVVLRLLLYLFIGAVAVLLLWVIWLLVRTARRTAAVIAAQPVAPAVPDLHDENVQAAQLPADGWLALAREQIAAGRWRLALRALYLATLARLASDGLIALAKFKTNLDYEREVRRRAAANAEIPARFAARRRGFEAVWYGRVEPLETDVRAWLAELERLTP